MRRYDLATVFTHVWYFGWFAHKMEDHDISDHTREIVGNRARYHLLEAKVFIDTLIHYAISELPGYETAVWGAPERTTDIYRVF